MDLRAPSSRDAAAVADLFTRTDSPVAPEVVLRDWQRDGFDLQRDAWVWSRRETICGFGAVFPGGWIWLAADTDELRSAIFSHVLSYSAGRGDKETRVMIPTKHAVCVGVARAHGFAEDCRFSTYRGSSTASTPPTPAGVDVRPVAGESDERSIFDLARRSYGDEPDFKAWRRWITGWEYDPALWLLASDHGRQVGGLVAFTFPTEGWIKRVAVVDAENEQRVAVALVQQAMQTFATRGVKSVGLPAGSDEPQYLHSVARALALRLDDERILFARSAPHS